VTVHGIDFSGSARAGKKIWIATGVIGGKGVEIVSCLRASDLPGGSAARQGALEALRRFIAVHPESVFGLDFPFSIPAELIERLAGGRTWDRLVAWLCDEVRDAAEFRDACREISGGKELRRATDLESATPFCPYNLRLFRQTYYGIRDLLTPCVADGSAVVPMQRPGSDCATLVEVCPASTLKANRMYGEPYKGRGAERRAQRARVLDRMRKNGTIVHERLRESICEDPEGDALDSVIAAHATAAAVRRQLSIPSWNDAYGVEGYVFV
jgi:hypothetical protein